MNILKRVKEILAEQNPQEKDNLLEQLSQVLEYYHELNEAEVIEVVRLLLPAALQEDDENALSDIEIFMKVPVQRMESTQDENDNVEWDIDEKDEKEE